jgi:RNA polymerase sigma-70 factor (sigma-E family)
VTPSTAALCHVVAESAQREEQRVDQAEREAFEALVDARSTRLLRTAYLLTGDWGLAEDLLQTALAKTWLRWSQVRDKGAAEAYVRQTMTRTFATWWRRRWRGEVPTDVLPERVTASDPYADVIAQQVLHRALAELPPRQRAIVVLRFYEDLTEAQVAEVLGCSVGTVKSTVSRALVRLRTSGLLQEAGYGPRTTPEEAL